jgi:hypothetical protein
MLCWTFDPGTLQYIQGQRRHMTRPYLIQVSELAYEVIVY